MGIPARGLEVRYICYEKDLRSITKVLAILPNILFDKSFIPLSLGPGRGHGKIKKCGRISDILCGRRG
jgi:hypothetical protein